MNYPQVTTTVNLRKLDYREIRALARRATDVTEPKYERIAMKAGIAIAAISIVGLPIAWILNSHRVAKREAAKEYFLNKFKKIVKLQTLHRIEEEITIKWRGNRSPDIVMHGDTALLWQAAAKYPEVATKYPSYSTFNLSRLRYNSLTNPGTALRSREIFDNEAQADREAPQAPQPPSYRSVVVEPPPPNYNELDDELETRL